MSLARTHISKSSLGSSLILRGSPTLCFPSRKYRAWHRYSQMDRAGRDLEIAWFLSIFKAAEPFSKWNYTWSSNTKKKKKADENSSVEAGMEQVWGLWALASPLHIPARKPLKTLDSKKIQCENYQSRPNPPLPPCSWEGWDSERESELLTDSYEDIRARIIKTGPLTPSPRSFKYPQLPS